MAPGRWTNAYQTWAMGGNRWLGNADQQRRKMVACCLHRSGWNAGFRLLVEIDCLNFVYVVLKNCFISFKFDGYIYLPRLLSPLTF
jgi:hypothetical protein